jgi:hypothetical protein
MSIAALWRSTDVRAWDTALAQYRGLMEASNKEQDRRLGALDLERLRHMDGRAWHDFLQGEYLDRINAATGLYGRTINSLRGFVGRPAIEALDQYRKRLLTLDPTDITAALKAGGAIPGLGVTGASGLLSLMYPGEFGTIDQFLVKALRDVERLPEAAAVARMKSRRLMIRDGAVLIGILRRKAAELSRAFGVPWTPSMVSDVLRMVGRRQDDRSPVATAAPPPLTAAKRPSSSRSTMDTPGYALVASASLRERGIRTARDGSDGSLILPGCADGSDGKFAGDHFSGTYNSGLCGTERSVSLDRAK